MYLTELNQMVIPREGTRHMTTIFNDKNPLFNLSQPQLAYIAGFIDGDGSINGQIIKSNDYKRKFKLQVFCNIFSKIF